MQTIHHDSKTDRIEARVRVDDKNYLHKHGSQDIKRNLSALYVLL